MRDYAELHRQVNTMVRLSAQAVVPHVYDLIQPSSVLDVGCGNALWLAEFQKLGVSSVLGVDGDYLDSAARAVPDSCFQEHDLKTRFHLNRRFDLVISLEVAEHLPADCAEGFVEDLTHHGDVVLFSAAIPGQGGWHHVNEQPASYWADLFARHNYSCLDVVRPYFWSDPNVAFWYAQNTFLYIHKDSLTRYPRLATSVAHRSWPLDMIHPVLFRHKAELAQQSMQPSVRAPFGVRELIQELPGAVGRYMGKRIRAAA